MEFKLVCFDLDGTIVDETVSIWQTIHDHLKSDQSIRAEYREKYKKGEISYEDWAQLDIELWKEMGATKQEILAALTPLKLMNGAKETLDKLRESGVKMVIVSGSLNVVLEKVFPDYRGYFDHVFINNIFFDSEGKIQEVVSTIYDKGNKGDAPCQTAAYTLGQRSKDGQYKGDDYDKCRKMVRHRDHSSPSSVFRPLRWNRRTGIFS